MHSFPTMAQIPAVRLAVLSISWGVVLSALSVRWSSAGEAVGLSILALGAAVLLWRRQAGVAYVVGAFGIGLSMAASWQRTVPIRTDALLPAFPASVQGRIVEVLRQQPPVLRCIVEGWLDAQPLPPLRTRLLLHITGITGQEPWAQPGQPLRATIHVRLPRPAALSTDFPEWEYCAHLNVHWVGFAQVGAISWWEQEPTPLERCWLWILRQRQRLRQWITELYRAEVRGLALALLLGDRSELLPEQRREFALGGISHVLAVSGLHVGVLAGMVLIAVGFLRQPWLRWGIFSLGVCLVVILTGAQPSAVRAGAMAVLGWGLYCAHRQAHPLNVIAAVALLPLLLAPELALSRSFQLSVLATAGIVGLYMPFSTWLEQHVRWLPRPMAQLSALTLAAMCTSAPVAALSFQSFSLISVPLNLLAVPLSSAALVAGALGLLTYWLVPALGQLYSSAAEACLQLLVGLVHRAMQLPIVALEGRVSVAAACGMSLLLLWLLTAHRGRHILARIGIAALGIVLAYAVMAPRREAVLIPRDRLVVAFLPTAPEVTLAVLVDRFPRRKPRADPALERYLLELPGRLQIAYTGLAGELLAVRCFRVRPNTSVVPAPAELLQYVEGVFDLRVPVAQSVFPRRASSLRGHQRGLRHACSTKEPHHAFMQFNAYQRLPNQIACALPYPPLELLPPQFPHKAHRRNDRYSLGDQRDSLSRFELNSGRARQCDAVAPSIVETQFKCLDVPRSNAPVDESVVRLLALKAYYKEALPPLLLSKAQDLLEIGRLLVSDLDAWDSVEYLSLRGHQ